MNSSEFHALYPWARDDGKRPRTELFFTVDLPVTRAEIWPFIADTSRFNRALGLGRRHEREENGKLLVRESLNGIPLEWVEQPWTWLFESHAIAERDFVRGPFRHFRSVFHVLDNPRGGVTVCVQFSWILKSRLFGWLLQLPLQKVRRDITKLFREVSDAIANGRTETDENPYVVRQPIRDRDVLDRLGAIGKQLEADGARAEEVRALLEFVKGGDELELFRLRPLQLARKWKLDGQELVRACLLGTSAGLLTLSWDVTCPHCRGTRLETASLAGIPRAGRCDVCDIDFSTAGENAVEITFGVHESIRKVEKVTFCAAEPAKKTHIKWQQGVAAGEKASALFRVRPGAYRLRDVVSKRKFLVEVTDGLGAGAITWDVTRDVPEPLKIGPEFAITVRNDLHDAATLVFEELWWDQECLRPGRLFCVPEFQKLFSREALAAGVQLDLGNQTIFFSDVVGSTMFYQQAGDSAAFAAIVAHFEELTAILVRNNGSIIKTIGDAVMAAFHTPDDCLRACEEAQGAFSGPRSRQKVRLRISVHHGPVIAVNWNTGKDYFGNVVNFAAKMQACANAGEVAVSDEFLSQLRNTARAKSYPVRTQELKVAGRPDPASITVLDMNFDPSAGLRNAA